MPYAVNKLTMATSIINKLLSLLRNTTVLKILSRFLELKIMNEEGLVTCAFVNEFSGKIYR